MRERGVSGLQRWERKSFKLFMATKMNFFGVHMFHKMRESRWWLFRVSMLLGKKNLTQERWI